MAKLGQYEDVVPLADLLDPNRPGGRAWDGRLDALLQFGDKDQQVGR